MSDLRREKRDFVTVTVQYTYSYLHNDDLHCVSDEAITNNMSSNGLGLYTNKPLNKGQDIKIFSRRLCDEPRVAFVRWCSKVSESIFRVGLEFA